MASEPDVTNHTLELLKRLNSKMDAMGFDLLDIKARLTSLEEGQASLSGRMATVEFSMATTNKRLDRIGDRLDRIERRLDLKDTDDDAR